jgi:MinD-like ATPase involved in chromosome partitioning or flagellar assembly
MTKVVTFHSMRGGTGKTTVATNVAAQLALQGARVALVDAGLQAPAAHLAFGLRDDEVRYTLNEYLWGQCDIKQTAHDVTKRLAPDGLLQTRDLPAGRLFLVPSSLSPTEIARIVRERYDVGLLSDGLHALTRELAADYILIDTHPGIHDESLFAVSVADLLFILLRVEPQDLQSTGAALELARRLDVATAALVVNMAPDKAADIRARLEAAYRARVETVIPYARELAAGRSGSLLVVRQPDHPVSIELGRVTRAVTGA